MIYLILVVEFDRLLETQVTDFKLYSAIKKLLDRKESGEELDIEPRIEVISNFLEEQMEYYKEYVKHVDDKKSADTSELNDFLGIL